jgi:hypothetical protein
MNENVVVSAEDLAFIRSLSDFDLTMLISEINDHGWKGGGEDLIPMMRDAFAALERQGAQT